MTITLKELDREELLALLRDRAGFSLRDMVWARWEVAEDRTAAIGKQILELHTATIAALAKYNASLQPQQRRKAWTEYQRAQEAIDRARRRQRKQQVLADQLYAQHQALQADPISRALLK